MGAPVLINGTRYKSLGKGEGVRQDYSEAVRWFRQAAEQGVAVGAVDIAGTQRAAFQITELIEHEQRVIAGAGVMAVPRSRRDGRTPTAAANLPAHGGRSCRFAHQRVSRPPSRSSRVHRRVRGMPTIPRQT